MFVNCQSVLVMTGPPSFLLQTKLIWLMVLSSKYLLYDFNVTTFQKFKKKAFSDIFLLLVPPEIFSDYPDIVISDWFRENVGHG